MKKFKCSIKLIYEYDNIGNQKENEYSFDDYTFSVPNDIIITISEGFHVVIDNVICNNRDEAIIVIGSILLNICKTLTLIIQISSKEYDKLHSNISFDNTHLNLIECPDIPETIVSKNYSSNKVYHIRDNVGFSDNVFLKKIHSLSFKYFNTLFHHPKGDRVDILKDVLYRAFRCRDVQSKFFTLFTMIEYIETEMLDSIETSKLLTEDQVDKVMVCVQNLDYKDNGIKNRVISRVGDIVKSATLESRADKLCYIIKKNYGINKISESLINIDIEPKKMNEFIEYRNSLFHGKTLKKAENLEETEINKNYNLTNELLFLCLEIIKIESK